MDLGDLGAAPVCNSEIFPGDEIVQILMKDRVKIFPFMTPLEANLPGFLSCEVNGRSFKRKPSLAQPGDEILPYFVHCGSEEISASQTDTRLNGRQRINNMSS